MSLYSNRGCHLPSGRGTHLPFVLGTGSVDDNPSRFTTLVTSTSTKGIRSLSACEATVRHAWKGTMCHFSSSHPKKVSKKVAVVTNINHRRKEKVVNLKAARKLFKEHAGLKYEGSRYIVLQRLIEATYRGKTEVDVTGRTFAVKTKDLRRFVNVKGQQLMRLLKSIDEVKDVVRQDGEITYRLDVNQLLQGADERKVQQKALDRKRTEKGRAKKASQRHEQKVTTVQKFFRDLQEINRIRALKFNGVADYAGVETEMSVPARVQAPVVPKPELVPIRELLQVKLLQVKPSGAEPNLNELEERWRNEKDNALRAKYREAFMAARAAQSGDQEKSKMSTS